MKHSAFLPLDKFIAREHIGASRIITFSTRSTKTQPEVHVKRTALSFLAAFVLIVLFSKISTAEVTMTFFYDSYNPKIELKEANEYAGKKMIFDSVMVEASGFAPIYYTYQSSDNRVTYNMGRPLGSHMWYFLEKAFTSVGITVKPPASSVNIPQVTVTILAFSDTAVKYTVNVILNSNDLYEKEYLVKTKPLSSSDYYMSDIEKRAYGQFDAMASAILNDPGFRKAFLTKKK